MKMAPVISAIDDNGLKNYLVHTGQHYDNNMSKVFFEELGLPEPDKYLRVGSGSHASQTAKILVEFEKECLKIKPSLIVVAGDVNSTLACALAAVKLKIPVAHVEAGLRSFDNSMPEEINRILTDRISDLLFTSEDSGRENLLNEGVPEEKVHFVGNCMIDSISKFIPLAREVAAWSKYGLNGSDYCLVTLHRPANVDSKENIKKIVTMLNRMSKKIHIVFPVHPRTQNSIKGCSISLSDNIRLLAPLPYIAFLSLMSNAKLVFTDSGGIQEETTYLNIQCITFRDNTERPVTVKSGTNHLVGADSEQVITTFHEILNGRIKNGVIPPKWDGNAGIRIANIINNFL
jgi:UDP-N-acetylglucosamine 2-epimerase (non-hydrolysing)